MHVAALPPPILLLASSALFAANTVGHGLTLLSLAVVKAIVPSAGWRSRVSGWLVGIGENWIGVNSWLMRQVCQIEVELRGSAKLDPTHSYLVLCNHQSWVDIPVLQGVLNRRVPFLRFFLKSNLIYVPILGLCWWALDFPFMHRYTAAQLARRPELRGRDLKATQQACARFGDIPVSVMNFVEGTRFEASKHAEQGSPYRHLLRPKAGGVSFVLSAMGPQLTAVLDITVRYPLGRPTLLQLLSGQVRKVEVLIDAIELPAELIESGAGVDEAALRQRVEQWINGRWQLKDRHLGSTKLGDQAPESSIARASTHF